MSEFWPKRCKPKGCKGRQLFLLSPALPLVAECEVRAGAPAAARDSGDQASGVGGGVVQEELGPCPLWTGL